LLKLKNLVDIMLTFAELMKEECNIINSKDYEQLRKLKIENPKDLYLVLD
jgi:hypothetical protein